MTYLIVLAFHIMSVISWMAMLLYLPRLMVYHCDADKGGVQSETFKIMERRLLRGIGTPAMLATWAFGLYLFFSSGYASDGSFWLYVKLTGVLALSAVHMRLAWHVKLFAKDSNAHSSRYFRIINEVPAGFMVVIILLVVTKPF